MGIDLTLPFSGLSHNCQNNDVFGVASESHFPLKYAKFCQIQI